MKHIHILGICGTFMGGIAALAREAGFTVTGCDLNVYPPMSEQLTQLGIELIEGYHPDQLNVQADVYIIGNAISRGNPLLESILDQGLPYTSGPQWLAENILQDKWVLAVAGTHGKTTTTAMLAWLLEAAGLNPGFLIGGVPCNFQSSARLTDSPFFVIEADEYDTAFFDKRSKFVHYRPRTLILNNLEFDHADIFATLGDIETQFHHVVRTVPSQGLIIANGQVEAIKRVIGRGCWTPQLYFGVSESWHIDENVFTVKEGEAELGTVHWSLLGGHNRLNALAALLAARHVGVPISQGIESLSQFQNVKRRMEIKGQVNGVTVYDDFTHHPTAIETTLAGLREKIGSARILAVLEPRSNTMKLGSMKHGLPVSLQAADQVYCYAAHLGWDAAAVLSPLGEKAHVFTDLNVLIEALVEKAQAGDHILVMSNGGFGGIHEKLLHQLEIPSS